jgi:hypothetical protein
MFKNFLLNYRLPVGLSKGCQNKNGLGKSFIPSPFYAASKAKKKYYINPPFIKIERID